MTSNNPPMIVKTDNSTEIMRVDSSGKIGVNTTTPTNPLHVNSNTGIRQNSLYLSGGNGWSSLSYNAHHNDANSDWVFPEPSHEAVTIEMDDNNGSPRFQVWSTTTGAPTSFVQRLAIDGNSGNVLMAQNGGKVGIGTTTPRNALGIRAQGQAQELLSFENPAGQTKWHINQNLGGNNSGLNFVETGVADGRLFLRAGGNTGIGTTTPTAVLHVSSGQSFANPQVEITQTTPGDFARIRLHNATAPSGAIPFWDIAAGPGDNSFLNFYAQDHGNIMSVSATGVTISGSLMASQPKHFVQDHPTDPTKQIVYASLEGGEAGTYTRGTWKLENGKAVIELSEHFGMVTSEDGLTVQLTPHGEWLQLYVMQLTTRQLVVREAQGKSGQFDYHVHGVRKGFEHHEVIQQRKEY